MNQSNAARPRPKSSYGNTTADGAARSIRNMRIEQVLLGLLQISIRRPRHLCFRYRFHQQRKCFVETCGAGSFTSIVPEAHHDEIMRRNYQSGLPAGARHVIRVSRDRISPVAVEPEEGSIDRTLVGVPGGRDRADELGISFRKNALAVPDAVLKIEIAKPRPIAPGGDLIALSEKISERIGFDHHGADAELVE